MKTVIIMISLFLNSINCLEIIAQENLSTIESKMAYKEIGAQTLGISPLVGEAKMYNSKYLSRSYYYIYINQASPNLYLSNVLEYDENCILSEGKFFRKDTIYKILQFTFNPAQIVVSHYDMNYFSQKRKIYNNDSIENINQIYSELLDKSNAWHIDTNTFFKYSRFDSCGNYHFYEKLNKSSFDIKIDYYEKSCLKKTEEFISYVYNTPYRNLISYEYNKDGKLIIKTSESYGSNGKVNCNKERYVYDSNGLLETLNVFECGKEEVGGEYRYIWNLDGSIREIIGYDLEAFPDKNTLIQFYYKTCGANKDSDVKSAPLSIFPEPTFKLLNANRISNLMPVEIPVLIYNSIGQIIITSKVSSTMAELDLKSLPGGYYYVRIVSDNFVNGKAYSHILENSITEE